GIGTTTPSNALSVVGNVVATGTITGGGMAVTYQDVAEWVPAAHQIPPSSVVVLDSERTNAVTLSASAYDTRVAGVISPRPGIVLGEPGENKVQVATTGRVKVRVDATHAPIHLGDLLVTSDKPGVAMRSEAVTIGGVSIHRPGTLIG